MKLTHETETAKKEDGEKEKPRFSRAPLAEKIVARVAAALIAVSVPVASCTFEPAGLETLPDTGQDASTDMDGGPDADTDHDSGPDADVHDSGPDADVDGGHDAGPDVDAGHDAGPDVDSGTDAGMDAGPDVDAGSDAGPDVDAGTDAGPDVDAGPTGCVDADVGTYSGIITTTTPHTVGGYVFEYTGISGLNTHFHITCGGSVVEESLSCPLGSETIKDDIPSGRRIRISPISGGATAANVSITVELL